MPNMQPNCAESAMAVIKTECAAKKILHNMGDNVIMCD